MTRLPDGTVWERSGVPGAPSAVLIHGLGLNRSIWQWMKDDLAQTYDVICYDLFGQGESGPPPRRPSLTLFSRQLAGVMQAAGVEHAAIVGFSLGGMICRRFAQDHPDRVDGLVILNSPHRRSPAAQTAILNRVAQAASEGPQATVEAALERWFTDAYRAANPDVMDTVRKWVLANDKVIYPTIYRVLAEGIDEIVDPAPRLSMPALVITGDEDFGNGPEMTDAIAAEIDGGAALILPGLRHMALVEAPAAVNRPVKAFLDLVLLHGGLEGGPH